MKTQQLFIAKLTLVVMLSCSGYTQPREYQSGGTDFDTGHIRGPHHPRSSRGAHDHQHYIPHKTSESGGVGVAGHDTKLTYDKQLLHDKEHLKEDLGEWAFQDGTEMSNEEMEFHYFKSHDFDNNSMLDGLEILQAISHILPMTEVETDIRDESPSTNDHHHHHNHDSPTKNSGSSSTSSGSAGTGTQARAPLTDARKAELIKQREDDFNYYVELIDKVLAEDDLNRDGYLSYMEYSIGRRREEEVQKKTMNNNNKY